MLDEKHVLKRASVDLIPREILERPKQPYRAPDAPSFVGAEAPEYVGDVLSEATLLQAGLFEPAPVSALLAKCREHGGGGRLSNADNMAFLGILSTQLLWHAFVHRSPDAVPIDAGRVRSHGVTLDSTR